MEPDPTPPSAATSVNLRHVALLVILVALLLSRPFLPDGVADSVFLVALMISSWLAGGRSRIGFASMLVVGVAALALLGMEVKDIRVIQQWVSQPAGFFAVIAIFLLLVYSGGVILHSLLTAEKVFANEVIGALNIYLIIGFVWAYLYVLLELSLPGSFRFADSAGALGLRLKYYSFITLTSVGFGDVTPVSPFAQMLAVLEAITGQFYLAVVVAYLVAMYITQNMTAR